MMLPVCVFCKLCFGTKRPLGTTRDNSINVAYVGWLGCLFVVVESWTGILDNLVTFFFVSMSALWNKNIRETLSNVIQAFFINVVLFLKCKVIINHHISWSNNSNIFLSLLEDKRFVPHVPHWLNQKIQKPSTALWLKEYWEEGKKERRDSDCSSFHMSFHLSLTCLIFSWKRNGMKWLFVILPLHYQELASTFHSHCQHTFFSPQRQ